ncbi:CL17A protein, partial [Podargus strigoides]|nr:CL17A protein [Podargus strigoides]
LLKGELFGATSPRFTPAALSPLGSCPRRAIAPLYVLLALAFVFFTALTIVILQRVSAVREVLEEARMGSEKGHTTAWHNLSEVQHILSKQLSGELKEIHGRLINVSQEVENVRRQITQCQAECRKELSNRFHVLEQRDPVGVVLQKVAEVKQEQSRISAMLNATLELTGNLCMRCPAGWEQFSKSCYFFSDTKKSWHGAKDYCSNFNAHLAIVNSEQENKYLANHIMENRVFWLGLTDMYQEGTWQWVNNRPVSLSFWNTDEPNDAGHHGEDCASMYSSGRWNDDACSRSEAWICERSC